VWTDADGDGVFDGLKSDQSKNATEIWTAWWVPPSNDPEEQVRLLNTLLEKLHRFHTYPVQRKKPFYTWLGRASQAWRSPRRGTS